MDDQGTGSAGGGPKSPPVSWPPPDLPPGPDTPGAPEAPPTSARRILEAVAWVVGFLGLLFFGRVYAILSGSRTLTAYEVGQVVGTILGAVLIGVLVRWVVVKVRRRGRILSPWILVVAIVILLLGVGRQPGIGASATPSPSAAPLESYLAIASPFTLAAATPDEETGFASITTAANGRTEARRVIADEELVGYLVVVDARATDPDEDLRRFETGVKSNPGAEAHRATVRGRDVLVAIGTASGMVIITWIERPYLLLVYGVDEEDARLLAESVMAGYE